MKLVSLNTFGASYLEPLIEFIKVCARDADIFCLQEVLDTPGNPRADAERRLHLFGELEKILTNFTGFFAPTQDNYDSATGQWSSATTGQATFVRNKYAISANGYFFICNQRNSFVRPDYTTFPCNASYVQLNFGRRLLTVCNVHGIPHPADKLDCPARLEQSRKILNFLATEPGEKIVTGDFNLLPNTQSIRLFEENGFANIIKNFGITTTRGSLVKKLHPEYVTSPGGWQEFADYTFVSPGIAPTTFTVPDLPISDHLPLILEFD